MDRLVEPMAARFRHTRNDVELCPEDDVALAPLDDLVIRDASDPSSSCHKWRPYLVSPYMQSGNGAIEELSWVPALCHRRQQSTEQTHVTMVFAAAGCRFRANLELCRQLYARGDRRRSACDAGLWQAAGDQRLSQGPAAYVAGGIVAVMAEDCGPCTQLVIDMAQQGGVDP